MAHRVLAKIKDQALIQERRQRLVRAALQRFIRKGYHRTTVREIGRAAGFTQGTIYNYVRSKGDILYLVCDEKIRAHQEAIARAVEGISDPLARLSAAIRAFTDTIDAHQDTILLVYRESHALDRRSLRAVLGRMAEFIEMFERLLDEAARNRQITLGSRRLTANIVTFLPVIIALRRWDLRRWVPKELVKRELTAFMLRGLSGVGLAANGRPPQRRGRSLKAWSGAATRQQAGNGGKTPRGTR